MPQYVVAVKNTHSTTEEMLDVVFSMRSVSYQIVCNERIIRSSHEQKFGHGTGWDLKPRMTVLAKGISSFLDQLVFPRISCYV
jgi:hypothetical protein